MEALYGLLDDAGDDAEGNITLFINMRHHKGYLILFPDCPAVIAGVGNGIDTDGEPDKDGAFMDVFHSSGASFQLWKKYEDFVKKMSKFYKKTGFFNNFVVM